MEENETCKILRNIVNNKLNWEDHIKNFKPKLRKITMVLRRIKYRIPNEQLRKIVIGTFLSKIIYSLTVYVKFKFNQEII